PAFVTLLSVRYQDHEPETYMLPMAFTADDLAVELAVNSPQAVFSRLTLTRAAVAGLLFDACYDPAFGRAMLKNLGEGTTTQGRVGTASFAPMPGFAMGESEGLTPLPLRSEQSNTSLVFDAK